MKTIQLLTAATAVLALAACETTPGSEGGAGGTGIDGTSGSYDSSVTPGTQADLNANIGDRVYYATDSSTLDSEAQATLSRQAAWLNQYSSVNITVEGHCDERGTREYNIALGERRAYAAKKYLVSQGVSPDRISTVSYGKERPAAIGSDASSWAQNRRAVSVVVQ